MLLGISAIAASALNHAAQLLSADTTLTRQYLEDFRKRVDDAGREVLGADRAGDFRHATIVLRAASGNAAAELGLTKAWIEGKFMNDPVRRDELLDILGFSAFYSNAVHSKRHEDMMQLLLRFDEGLDVELAEEFVVLGLPVERLAILHKLAADYSARKASQKSHKGHKSELTESDTILLNGLFREAMAISRLAKNLFKKDPATRATFTYRKTHPPAKNGNDDSKKTASTEAA
jgi:hypothetical protein